MKENKWELQEAKSRLSELVEKAAAAGPQIITKGGTETVVVISVQEYQKLKEPRRHIVDLFLDSPLRGEDLDLTRNKDTGRDVGF